nr:hypothetical protein [Enterococcus casseliflavus]
MIIWKTASILWDAPERPRRPTTSPMSRCIPFPPATSLFYSKSGNERKTTTCVFVVNY